MLGIMLKKREHKIVALIIVVVLIVIGIFLFFVKEGEEREIATFEECITAGYPIMESYPRQCRTPEGKLFIEEIGYPLNPAS